MNVIGQLVTPHVWRWDYQAPARDLYAQWHEERFCEEEAFRIENICFPHDPRWRERLMSIQSAREGNHVVWRVVGGMFVLAGGIY